MLVFLEFCHSAIYQFGTNLSNLIKLMHLQKKDRSKFCVCLPVLPVLAGESSWQMTIKKVFKIPDNFVYNKHNKKKQTNVFLGKKPSGYGPE